jgi:hypothetical protein
MTVSVFNVVALGSPGSGKTVFLSVLYNAITSGQLADGVRIRLNLAESSWLEEVYRQVSNPDASWPEGTHPGDPMRELLLQFEVQRSRRSLFSDEVSLVSYPALTISYVDYAGELLTDAHRHSRAPDLERRVDEAHVFLCFVDGHRLMKVLDGQRWDEIDRENIGKIISRANDRNTPTIVVVTKWDLLESRYTLEDVVDVLMRDRRIELSSLVQRRSARKLLSDRPIGGIWVVPVSAVGPEFVEVSADGERITKSGRGKVMPGNISIPLTTGLVDVARMALKEHGRPRRRGGDRSADTAGPDTANSAELRVGLDGVAVDIGGLLAFAGDTARAATWPAMFAMRRMRRAVRQLRARGITGVSSEEGALLYVALMLRTRLDEFMRRPEYRAARLWGDGDEWQLR